MPRKLAFARLQSFNRQTRAVPAFQSMMILPLAAFALLWFLLSRTRTAKRLIRGISPKLPAKVVAIVLVIAAMLVLTRGNVWVALCLFGLSLWQLGQATRHIPTSASPSADATSTTPSAATSRVRSLLIEMDYEFATGRVTGRVLAGLYAGASLDALDLGQVNELYAVCRQTDPDGIRLLDPYLDRRFPGWRTAADGHDDPRERRARFTSRMSEDEAYEVLGLRRGASRDDIVRSHRSVMKRWHPDQGGTAALAARANEAKEVLMRSHA